jgi:hypothetical protein
MKQIRANLQALGESLKGARWAVWRTFTALGAMSDLLSSLPNKQDTWFSATGKFYLMAQRMEAHTGLLFGGKRWYEAEAEANNWEPQALPIEFFRDSIAVNFIEEKKRGDHVLLITFKTSEAKVVHVPMFSAAFPKPGVSQAQAADQYWTLVYSTSSDEFEAFLASIWEGYKNRVHVDMAYMSGDRFNQKMAFRPIQGCADPCVGLR